MARALVTRRVLARELAFSAASQPLNVAVPAVVVVASFVLTLWLLPVAALVYAALVLATFLDGDAAEAVGRKVYGRARGTSSRVARGDAAAERLAPAYAVERQIRRTIEEAQAPLPEVESEIERLMGELERLADHAERIDAYLAADDEALLRIRLARLEATQTGDTDVDRANASTAAALREQLAARGQLERRLSQFDAQMEHIAATLGVVHAQLMRMLVAEEASAQTRVAAEVRALRRELGAVAEALDEL